MPGLGRRAARYAALYGTLAKIGLLQQMAYRPHFFFMVGGKVVRMALLLCFFQAVFLQVDRIGRWTYDGILLLFGTFQLVDYLVSITFQRNLGGFLPARIHSGDLDARLLLPVNHLFLVSFEVVDVMDVFSFIPAAGFLLWVLWRMDFAFTVLQAASYAGLVAAALVFIYAVFLIIASISFWTVQSSGLSTIFDNILKVARFPTDIFAGIWKVVLLYLFPVALIAPLPAEALLGTLRPGAALAAAGAAGGFLGAAVLLWRIGLRRYTSAST